MLKSLKRSTLAAAHGAGIMSFARESAWRRKRLLILGYHGVSTHDEHEWDGELYMPPSLVRERFETLRRGQYQVLPLGEAVSRLYDGSLPPRAVAITFDDGAYDFYTHARPLLEEFSFPATVYLTSYYSRYQRPVFNTMLRYRSRSRRTRLAARPSRLLPARAPLVECPARRRTACSRLSRLGSQSTMMICSAGDSSISWRPMKWRDCHAI